LAKIFKSRAASMAAENQRLLTSHAAEVERWQTAKQEHEAAESRRRAFLEQAIISDPDAMEAHLGAKLNEIVWPRETIISFDVSPQGRALWIDVDLPEIEHMPHQEASVPSRGLKLTVKEMKPAQMQRLYMRHVHGVGFRIIGESFAALPSIQLIVLSAFSQRPSRATGNVENEYLYSVKVTRQEWEGLNFENLAAIDIVECLAGFDLRRKMTKNGSFTSIEPFEVHMHGVAEAH